MTRRLSEALNHRPLAWRRRQSCPYLVAAAGESPARYDGSAAFTPADADARRLHCLVRPAVDLTFSYALDLCSGRIYPASECLFYRRAPDEH
jgi:hypothetical protein